jgi:hypothetical protein
MERHLIGLAPQLPKCCASRQSLCFSYDTSALCEVNVSSWILLKDIGFNKIDTFYYFIKDILEGIGFFFKTMSCGSEECSNC